MTLHKLISLLILITLVTGCSEVNSNQNQEKWESGIVSRVIDGDTIELKNGNVIRYLDINTPELNHPTNGLECYAEEAAELNRKYVEGKQIKLLKSGENQDKYGRYLRYVFIDNMFINGLLVYEGAAFSYSYGAPNILYQTLIQLEASARENENGLWKDCAY